MYSWLSNPTGGCRSYSGWNLSCDHLFDPVFTASQLLMSSRRKAEKVGTRFWADVFGFLGVRSKGENFYLSSLAELRSFLASAADRKLRERGTNPLSSLIGQMWTQWICHTGRATPVFTVTTFTINENNNQNRSIEKVQNRRKERR